MNRRVDGGMVADVAQIEDEDDLSAVPGVDDPFVESGLPDDDRERRSAAACWREEEPAPFPRVIEARRCSVHKLLCAHKLISICWFHGGRLGQSENTESSGYAAGLLTAAWHFAAFSMAGRQATSTDANLFSAGCAAMCIQLWFGIASSLLLQLHERLWVHLMLSSGQDSCR